MPATGHTLALTALPRILLRLIPGGPIARTVRAGQEYLNDPNASEAWVVALPEKLPVTEALELLDGLAETDMAAGGIILNRLPHDPFTRTERDALKAHFADRRFLGEVALHRIDAAERARTRLDESPAKAVVALPEVADGQAGQSVLVETLYQEMTRS